MKSYCRMTNDNRVFWLVKSESRGVEHNRMYFWCVCHTVMTWLCHTVWHPLL